MDGLVEEAILLYEQVIRLSPRDPNIAAQYAMLGLAHLFQSRTDEGIVWLEKAASPIHARPSHIFFLTAAYAIKGDLDRGAPNSRSAEAARIGSLWDHRQFAGQRGPL